MSEVNIDPSVVITELLIELEFHKNRKLLNAQAAHLAQRENKMLKDQLARMSNEPVKDEE